VTSHDLVPMVTSDVRPGLAWLG